MRITAGAAGAGALCVVLASGCAGASTDHHTAVGALVPAVAPTWAPAAVDPAGCVLQGAAPDTDPAEQGLVSVDRSPSGVVTIWAPGLNQRPCRAELVRDGPRIAHGLVAAIDTAPAIPPGSSACTAADDTEADLYFLYPGRPAEQSRVGLSGCESVDAPGRAPRQLSDDLAAALRPLAPGPWRTRLPSP